MGRKRPDWDRGRGPRVYLIRLRTRTCWTVPTRTQKMARTRRRRRIRKKTMGLKCLKILTATYKIRMERKRVKKKRRTRREIWKTNQEKLRVTRTWIRTCGEMRRKRRRISL